MVSVVEMLERRWDIIPQKLNWSYLNKLSRVWRSAVKDDESVDRAKRMKCEINLLVESARRWAGWHE